MLIFATSLALGSFKSDDPFVVIPCLAIAAIAFVILCVQHKGSVWWRLLAAFGLVLILMFIGWRDLRHGANIGSATTPVGALSSPEEVKASAIPSVPAPSQISPPIELPFAKAARHRNLTPLPTAHGAPRSRSTVISGDVDQSGGGNCTAKAVGGDAIVGPGCGAYDPNKPQTIWYPDGTKRVVANGGTSVGLFSPFGNVVRTIADMEARHDWVGLIAWGEEKKKVAPDWFTPDKIIADAHLRLCEPIKARFAFNRFITETENYDDWQQARDQAVMARKTLDTEVYQRTCLKPQ